MNRDDWVHPLFGMCTVAEAAQKLGVSVQTIYDHIFCRRGCRKWPEWYEHPKHGWVAPAIEVNRRWHERMEQQRRLGKEPEVPMRIPESLAEVVRNMIEKYKKGGG